MGVEMSFLHDENVLHQGASVIFFDLPLIESREKRMFELSALLNANFIIGVVDMNKPKLERVSSEISSLESFLQGYNTYAKPGLSIGGLIFNKVTDTALSENWINKIN